jgi:hypothetical protein
LAEEENVKPINVKHIGANHTSAEEVVVGKFIQLLKWFIICMEEWREIKEFPNYSVSNLGNILNTKINKMMKLNKNLVIITLV